MEMTSSSGEEEAPEFRATGDIVVLRHEEGISTGDGCLLRHCEGMCP